MCPQTFTELEEACKKEASAQSLSLPSEFSPDQLFDEVRGAELCRPILEAAATLRHHGELHKAYQ